MIPRSNHHRPLHYSHIRSFKQFKEMCQVYYIFIEANVVSQAEKQLKNTFVWHYDIKAFSTALVIDLVGFFVTLAF